METEFRDKSAGLIVFGIIEMLGGLLCAFFAAITLMSMAVGVEGMSARQMLPGAFLYLAIAVWLVTMAVGTFTARRWARVLMLAVSWLMLATGVMALGMMFYIMPKSYASANIPEEMMGLVLGISYFVMIIIYIVVPVIGILFYGNRNVRATFEHRDASPSWTERCPLPVFILSFVFAFGAVSMTTLGFVNFALPFFGVILSGWKGAVVILGFLAVFSFLAVAVYQQRPVGWWGAMVLLVAGVVSQLVTMPRIDMMEYYELMGYSDQMLAQMSNMDWMEGGIMTLMSVAYALPGVAFMLWVKRFFNDSNEGVEYE